MDENVETLIEEVERRPAIYDKSLKDYSNTNVKKRLWEEVCAAVIANWSDLEGGNKIKAGLEIQKKWQSLRTCFARELRYQKDKKLGQSTKKKRKYIYYDKLLFILPSIDKKEGIVNLHDQASGSEAETESEPTRRKALPSARPATLNWRQEPVAATEKRTFEESLLQILREKKSTDTDEDVNFALSLVPILKSLDDYEKMDAKIQIMTLLKSIKWPGGR